MATKKRKSDAHAIDEVGRLVIPKRFRDNLGLTDGSKVEIKQEGQKIIIQKYTPGCIFCDSSEENLVFNGKRICRRCLDEIRQMS